MRYSGTITGRWTGRKRPHIKEVDRQWRKPRCSRCNRTIDEQEVTAVTMIYPVLCERCQDND